MDSTYEAAPGTVATQADLSHSTCSPILWHQNIDSVGSSTLRCPRKERSRLPSQRSLRWTWGHGNRVAVHYILEYGQTNLSGEVRAQVKEGGRHM